VITIRPAAEADAPALRSIAVAAYQRYVPRIGREPAPMTADYLAAARHGRAWLAQDADGQAVGFIILIPQPGYLLVQNVGSSRTTDARRKAPGSALGECHICPASIRLKA
jgi:hypothetical protein